MVQYFSIRPSLISSFTVVGFFLSLSVTSWDATNKVVDISVICDRTRSAIGDSTHFCERLLNSTPAKPLAEHAIDVLQSNATNMIGLIDNLIEKTKGNPKDTLFLEMCTWIYGVMGRVLSDIDAIRRGLKSKDCIALDFLVVRMDDNNEKCLVNEEQPRHLPSLRDYGDAIRKVGSILQTILFFS